MRKYNRNNVKIAKSLRSNMTPWERKLWYCFLKYHKIKFRRQQTIDGYIVDFYNSDKKIILELAGSGHTEETKVTEDKIRDERLKELGYKVVRIFNNEIDNNFSGVCDYIDKLVTGDEK